MSIIYKPKGKAGEYSDLAVNLYKGCSHRCIYCYAPSATFTKREDFYNNIKPRKDIIEKLKKDAELHQGNGEHVLLSFTSDPYQPIDKRLKLTRQAIEILKNNGYNIKILTKAGELARRDFDLLNENDWFGITLTSYSKFKEWEMEAASYQLRVRNLSIAKKKGLKTWVSLEPVIFPDETLDIISVTHNIVDHYKVGKLNYHPRSKEIDWKMFANNVVEELEKYNCDYYIKDDLREYLD